MNQDSISVKRFKVLKRLDGPHELSDNMSECVFSSCFIRACGLGAIVGRYIQKVLKYEEVKVRNNTHR